MLFSPFWRTFRVPQLQTSKMANKSTESHVVAQLMSVLEEFGGSATHQQLTKRYQDLCGMPFDTVWMRCFQIRTVRELMAIPSFNSKFICTIGDNGMLTFHLKSTQVPVGHTDRATIAVQQLRETLNACGGCAMFSTVQNAFRELFGVSPDEKWRKAHFGHKNLKQVVEMPVFKNVFNAKLVGGVWTLQERADPNVEQWLVHLTEVLRSLGGSATHMQLNHEFKQNFGVTFDESWRYHFKNKTLKEVMQQSIVKAVVSTNISPSGVFSFSLQPHQAQPQPAKNPTTKQNVPDINQIRAKAVSQLEDVLQSLGGVATFMQLEFTYLDRFDRSFENFLVDYFSFNSGNPNGLNGIPAFRDKIRLIQKEHHSLTFELKTAQTATRSVITATASGGYRRSIMARPPKHIPNEGSPELGVKQLITALHPFIGGASFNELNREYLRLYGASLSKCWADCFEEMRLPQMLQVPEFKELVNIWQDGGTWIMQLKPRDDLDELTKGFFEDDSEEEGKNETPAPPEAPETKIPVSSVEVFDSPKQAVTKLRKILKHLGGRAFLDEVNAKCQERYGAPFDVRWSKENGVPDMETLVAHPLFTLLLAARRNNNSWEFKMKDQNKIDEITTQGVRLLKSALEACGGTAPAEEIMHAMGIATWAIYFPVESVRKLVEIPEVAEFATAAKEGGKWLIQLKKKETVNEDATGSKREDELSSEVENPSDYDDQLGMAVLQVVRTLADLGGMATFASLTNTLKKRYGPYFSLEAAFNEKLIGEMLRCGQFNSKLEILDQKDLPFRLRLERYWQEVENRILVVLDDSDEDCLTMSRFNHLYFAHYGLYTEIEKFTDEIISSLPGKEVIIKDLEVEIGDQPVTRRGLARRNAWKAKKRTTPLLYADRGDYRNYSVFR